MAIPTNINREHVLKAVQKINREGIPWRRQSTKYNLLYESEYYPPKYIVSIANLFANGEEYSSYDFSGGDETNILLERLGFSIVEVPNKESELAFFQIPAIEPNTRSREYNLYNAHLRDMVVYEYLFHSRTHRWLDENVLVSNPDESHGYHAMGILHFIGLKDKHKRIFKDLSIHGALSLLEQQGSDFSLVNQSLQRFEQQVNGERNIEEMASGDEYIELESIATTAPEHI